MSERIRTTRSGQKIQLILGGRSNVFLVTSGVKNLLVDTSPKFLRNTLEKKLLKSGIRKIDYLVLTHTHFDHADNSEMIREKFGAKVIVHENEAKLGPDGGICIPPGSNKFSALLLKLFSERLAGRLRCEPGKADLTVEERFDLKELGFNGYLMHTPGHSCGSISVILDDEIAIVGDVMVGALPWSVYPPFVDDDKILFESWEKLLATGCHLFLPAHGTPNTRKLVAANLRNKQRNP